MQLRLLRHSANLSPPNPARLQLMLRSLLLSTPLLLSALRVSASLLNLRLSLWTRLPLLLRPLLLLLLRPRAPASCRRWRARSSLRRLLPRRACRCLHATRAPRITPTLLQLQRRLTWHKLPTWHPFCRIVRRVLHPRQLNLPLPPLPPSPSSPHAPPQPPWPLLFSRAPSPPLLPPLPPVLCTRP